MRALKPILIDSLKVPKYSTKIDGISASMLQTYLTCRMKFLVGLNLLTSTEQRNFFYGSLFHGFLDDLYAGKVKSVNKSINVSFKKCQDQSIGMNAQEIEKNIEVANILGNGYIKFFKKDFIDMKDIHPEEEFSVQWLDYRLRGKIDLRFQRSEQNRIMEHKNFGQIKDDEVMKEILMLNFQALFYVTAMEQKYNKKIHQLDYNIIRVPRHKVNDGESFTEFLLRFKKEVDKKPEHFFKRYPLIFTERQKLDFKTDLLCILREVDRFLLFPEKYLYHNYTACEGRKYNCDLFRCCASGKLIGMQKKERLFTELSK